MKKRIVILGAGESGTGAAILANALPAYSEVFVSDCANIKPEYEAMLKEKQIPFEQGEHSHSLILDADEVVKSPGIPETAQIVRKLKEKDVPVISEIEFAGRHTTAKKICITGSNGKTTTTMLTYEMFKKAGLKTALAGNVGRSMALQVLENQFDYFVIELSSFQLDGMYEFKADVAILMNITPDHLDRYQYDFQNYINSKFRILQNMTGADFFIYCADDPVILREIKKRSILPQMLPFSFSESPELQNTQGAYAAQGKLNILFNHSEFNMSMHELALKGRHNAYNSMAAGIAAKINDISNSDIRESLKNFQSIEHRLEPVLKIKSALYVNDSKATNINSTWYALESFDSPIVWIVGGVDKGNDYSQLLDLVRQKVRTVICLGKNNQKIHQAFGKVVETVDADDMERAVKAAYYFAKPGDTVLLSPACASFDLFENYMDRGRQFKQLVKKL